MAGRRPTGLCAAAGTALLIVLAVAGTPRAADDAAPQLHSFEITAVVEGLGPQGDRIGLDWRAVVAGLSLGVHHVRLGLAVSDATGRVFLTAEGETRQVIGTRPEEIRGRAELSRDEWVRADGFEAALEVVPPPVAVSGLLIRALRVLPGTPMALGEFVPLRWAAVATNPGTSPAEARLELRIWDGAGVAGVYPVQRLKLAGGAAVKLGAVTIVDGAHWQRAESVTLDAVTDFDGTR